MLLTNIQLFFYFCQKVTVVVRKLLPEPYRTGQKWRQKQTKNRFRRTNQIAAWPYI